MWFGDYTEPHVETDSTGGSLVRLGGDRGVEYLLDMVVRYLSSAEAPDVGCVVWL